MDIDQSPPWSGRMLARLGEALAKDEAAPAACPSYGDVMEWHSDLCSEVATRILLRDDWTSYSGNYDVAARAKTIDTLRDKLRREQHLALNQVQDLAGVRVDLDCTLDEQTDFAQEVVDLFGSDRAAIKDIRQNPHSGYRAVHVWLRLPAGRVEIQIRTRGQSAWANAYERLGDLAGRHIRYGEQHESPAIQNLVDHLQFRSKAFAELEERYSALVKADAHVRRSIDGLMKLRNEPAFDEVPADMRDKLHEAIEGEPERREKHGEVMSRYRSDLEEHVEGMREIRRMLDSIDEKINEEGERGD